MTGFRPSGWARSAARTSGRSLIRQMVATGFLRIDIGGYGGIGITDKGLGLLRGDGEFLYREDTVIARTPREGSGPPAWPATTPENRPWPAEDSALMGALKALRLEIARERGVPAYIVFPDRTLIDMVRRRPRTEAEFRRDQRRRRRQAEGVRRAVPGRHRGRAGRGGRRRSLARGPAVTSQIVITEKASQAKDVRTAVGSRYGAVLAAEGHLLDLCEPRGRQPCLEALVDGVAEAGRALWHQARQRRQQGGEAEGDPGRAEDGGTGCGSPPTATARGS